MKNGKAQSKQADRWTIDGAGIAVCLLVTALVYWVGAAPVVQLYAKTQTQTSDLRRHKHTVAELVQSQRRVGQKLKSVRQSLDETGFRLQPAAQLNNHLAKLTRLATANGLEIHEVQPGEVMEGTYFRSIPIRITGAGAYPTCVYFLHQLHKNFLDTRVRSFGLTAKTNTPNPTVTIELDLLWHTTAKDAKGPM